ncbi:hypothetical protein GCM10009670_14530 [Citricoccus alkalitolerans]
MSIATQYTVASVAPWAVSDAEADADAEAEGEPDGAVLAEEDAVADSLGVADSVAGIDSVADALALAVSLGEVVGLSVDSPPPVPQAVRPRDSTAVRAAVTRNGRRAVRVWLIP